MLRLPLDVGGANVFRQHHKHINQKHAAEYSLTEAQVSDARNWSNLQGEALSSAVFSNVESLAPPISKRISTAVRPSSLALPLPIPLSVSFRSAFLSHLLNYILK